MAHKSNFEALDMTLCGILLQKDNRYSEYPFSGMTIIWEVISDKHYQ